jgi:hypothetical protein
MIYPIRADNLLYNFCDSFGQYYLRPPGNMKLRTISTSHVAEDSAAMAAREGSSNLLLRSERFNTTHHSHDEIIKVIPETPTFTHGIPPWTPYSYTIWRKLIAKSQGLINHHILDIPSFLYEDLMLLHSSWLRCSDISAASIEGIIEDWSASKSGKKLAALLDGTKRWFIRLDQMSPKDSPIGGGLPSSTFADVVTKICSSMRAFGSIQNAIEEAERDRNESGPKIQLILNPWNDGMDPAKEFRVFVPPPAARGITEPHIDDLKISGISQYRWHQPLQLPPGRTVQWVVDCATEGAQRMLAAIVPYMGSKMGTDMQNLLLEHGFSFDIALQEDGSVQLIEMNPFGAMSGCGACLFNWLLDARMLYALDEGEIAVMLEAPE